MWVGLGVICTTDERTEGEKKHGGQNVSRTKMEWFSVRFAFVCCLDAEVVTVTKASMIIYVVILLCQKKEKKTRIRFFPIGGDLEVYVRLRCSEWCRPSKRAAKRDGVSGNEPISWSNGRRIRLRRCRRFLRKETEALNTLSRPYTMQKNRSVPLVSSVFCVCVCAALINSSPIGSFQWWRMQMPRPKAAATRRLLANATDVSNTMVLPHKPHASNSPMAQTPILHFSSWSRISKTSSNG